MVRVNFLARNYVRTYYTTKTNACKGFIGIMFLYV